LPAGQAPFTVILANPPYVAEGEWEGLSPVIRRHEDPAALLAGHDGLAVIRRIIAQASAHLAAHGLLALEIGENQRHAAAELLEQAGFHDIQTATDLGGHPRIVSALRG
jgi:release factor glutamine methyltransferase